MDASALRHQHIGEIGQADLEPRLPTTMELFRDVISKHVDREHSLEERKRALFAQAGERSGGSLEDFSGFTEDILALQMAYQEKSMSSALILNTGKSAEGFCKTLMRSQ